MCVNLQFYVRKRQAHGSRTSSAFPKRGRLRGFSHFRSAGLETHLLWVSLFIVVLPESCGIYLNVFVIGHVTGLYQHWDKPSKYRLYSCNDGIMPGY